MRKACSLHTPPPDNECNDPSQGSEESHSVMLCQLDPEVNGYVDIVRGGVLAALLDKTLDLCAEIYRVFISEEWEHLITA